MKMNDFEVECKLYSEIEWEICNQYNLGDPQSGGLGYEQFMEFGKYFDIYLRGKYKSLSAHIMIYKKNGGYAVTLTNVDITQNR